MNRQYDARRSNESPQKDTDNWILQRTAVRELPAKPLIPQTQTAASHCSGIKLDLMQIPVSDRSAMPVQAKLEIGPANDKYEKEADRVAKQVVQKLHEPHSAQLQKPQTFQGEVNQEVEEALQRKSRLQLKGNQGEMTAAPELESSISRSRGSGQPLSEGIREPMEKGFGGVDFSGVKVHTDGHSDQLNQSMQAKAFTTGQDVFFKQGAYAPGSREGQELIAHELTHVVQQNGGAVRRRVFDHQEFTNQPESKTGLPDKNQAGIESPNSMVMNDVQIDDHSRESTQLGTVVQLARGKQKGATANPETKKTGTELDRKWGKHQEDLKKYLGTTKFIQYVPENSPTIERAIASQQITDALYNPSKAFWVSVEGAYQLSSSAGKAKMIYTFDPAGAKSLMLEKLICGSGDYAEDNPEEWKGETKHPNYTIWKTNEIGAYGIGANRLAELGSSCQKIEVEQQKAQGSKSSKKKKK